LLPGSVSQEPHPHSSMPIPLLRMPDSADGAVVWALDDNNIVRIAVESLLKKVAGIGTVVVHGETDASVTAFVQAVLCAPRPPDMVIMDNMLECRERQSTVYG
jgi:hypothetical protein